MADPEGDGAWDVFFSYSHKDDRYRQTIDDHLALLKRQGLIASWCDHKISAGQDLDQEIARRLERAKIILLLVSSNFIASEYCFSIELKRAIEQHETGLARVVPIILKPCDWKSAPFGKLKVLPRDGKPIVKWNPRDDAYFNIATGIRDVVKELNANRQTPLNAGGAEATSARAGEEGKAALSAHLSIGAQLEFLRQVGCPYLTLKLVCTSTRPAKISGAVLRIRGSHYIKSFQDGYGSSFGYTPPPAKLGENDSLGFKFLPASPPNLPGGVKIDRDEACTFILPGLGFPIRLFLAAAPADVFVAVEFLDGRTETVLSGDDVQSQLSGLQEMCMAKPFRLNPGLPIGITLNVTSKTAPDVSAVGTRNRHAVVFDRTEQDREAQAARGTDMDVFGDFPEITAIGRDALQEQCDAWLKTSIARQCRVKVLTIGQEGSRLVISDVGIEAPPDIQGGEVLHFPLDYLLNYLIERVAPADQQARLRSLVEVKRFNAGPAVYQRFAVGTRKPLGLKCKNLACGALLDPGLMGYQGEPFIREVEPVICPKCGIASSYEPADFFVIPDGDDKSMKPDA